MDFGESCQKFQKGPNPLTSHKSTTAFTVLLSIFGCIESCHKDAEFDVSLIAQPIISSSILSNLRKLQSRQS